jgi:putative long chain acyl-CoA synthase
MFAYQAAAYRRSRDLASIVAFGAPVDTLAGLPMNLPASLAPAAADFMADHVFSRIDIPGWLARTGFQMLDPIKTAQSRLDFLRQLHDREALLPRQQRRFLHRRAGSRGPGRPSRAAQAVHRSQPDDDRRLFHSRRPGHAVRHRLPGAGRHR